MVLNEKDEKRMVPRGSEAYSGPAKLVISCSKNEGGRGSVVLGKAAEDIWCWVVCMYVYFVLGAVFIECNLVRHC